MAARKIMRHYGVPYSRTGLDPGVVAFRTIHEGGATFFDVHRFLGDAGFMLMWISPGLRGEQDELLEGDALFVRKN